MLAATSHTTRAGAAWTRAVAGQQNQIALALASEERLTDSALRLERSSERLNESGRRIDRGLRRRSPTLT
jgi:hypothetical protein